MCDIDLWGNPLNKSTTEDVLGLLYNQAELLAKKTDGVVLAKFTEIHYTYQPSKQETAFHTLDAISSTLGLISSRLPTQGKKVEINDDDDLADASQLYEKKDYKFEIFSLKHKYRVFTLHYSSAFPLTIDVEFGILEDKKVSVNVNSIEEVKETVRDIFTSNKVQFIIYKMKIEAEKQDD